MSIDDDAPLASLATSKLDDEAPLSSLASAAPKKEKAPPAPKKDKPPAAPKPAGGAKAASPKPKGKAKAAAPGKKPGNDDSYSYESYSSESSSSGSGEKKPKAKKKAVKPTGKRKMGVALKKLKSGSNADLGEGGEEDEDKEAKAAHKIDKRDRTIKQQVVAELLSRWWYALPDWPPPIESDYYKEKFKEKKLRQVKLEEWEWVPEEENGLRKVYMLSQFRGLFRNSSGDLIDLRPQETCPCFANFMKKDLPELYDLLAKAYEEQIKDLVNSKYNETKFEQELKSRLNAVKDKAAKAKDFGGIKRSKTA